MPCFNSWSRKLALIPLSLFLAGWIVYFVGFCWMQATWAGGLYFYTEEDSGFFIADRKLQAFYVSLIFGLIVLLCGALHAAVPQLPGVLGSVILALASTVHFAATGAVAYETALNITMTFYVDDVLEISTGVGHISLKNTSASTTNCPDGPTFASTAVSTAIMLMLIGSLIQITSWTWVMICSVFYKYRLKKKSRNQSSGGVEEDTVCPCHPRLLFSGPARKLSIPFILVSAIGWCVLISRLNFILFIPDYVLLLAPFLYIAAFSHAGFTGAVSSAIEVCVCILSMIYVPFLGVTFIDYGSQVYNYLQLDLYESEKYRDFIKISASIASLIFWAGVPALWPFYRHRLPLVCKKSKSSRQALMFDPDDDTHPLVNSV